MIGSRTLRFISLIILRAYLERFGGPLTLLEVVFNRYGRPVELTILGPWYLPVTVWLLEVALPPNVRPVGIEMIPNEYAGSGSYRVQVELNAN